MEKPKSDRLQCKALSKNFFQNKILLKNPSGLPADRRTRIEQKMENANNFNHGFIQNSPTTRFQHFLYFLLKQRTSFEGFESKFCEFDIDLINSFLLDKQHWKHRSVQHSQEYQYIVDYIMALKMKLEREKSRGVQRPKFEVKWDVLRLERMNECLAQKAILLEMEKQYIKIITSFERFLCFYLKRAYYGSKILDKMKDDYKRFVERLSNLRENIAFLNDFVKRKMVESQKLIDVNSKPKVRKKRKKTKTKSTTKKKKKKKKVTKRKKRKRKKNK